MPNTTPQFEKILERIQADPRYQANLDWGSPRRGHPEGTIRAHIVELQGNLQKLRHKLTHSEYAQLRVLIHVHDTFKPDATDGVAISDPRSHASLARAFLEEFCLEPLLLKIVQYHDEPYALWMRQRSGKIQDPQRWRNLMISFPDWTLILAFLIVDGCTEGKSREPLFWIFEVVPEDLIGRITKDDILM